MVSSRRTSLGGFHFFSGVVGERIFGGPRKIYENFGGPRKIFGNFGGPRKMFVKFGGPRKFFEHFGGPQKIPTKASHDFHLGWGGF